MHCLLADRVRILFRFQILCLVLVLPLVLVLVLISALGLILILGFLCALWRLWRGLYRRRGGQVGVLGGCPDGCLADEQKDAGIADDNADAGQHEGDHEEELLGRAIVFVVQNGARADAGVQAEPAPDAQPRGYHDRECDQPAGGYHERQVESLIDAADGA